MTWYKKIIKQSMGELTGVEDTFKERLGRCYELCGRYIMHHLDDNIKLVHGTITNKLGDGKTIDHAWIEKGDDILDLISDKRYSKEVYNALFDYKVINIYNPRDALKLMCTQHYGPWCNIIKK